MVKVQEVLAGIRRGIEQSDRIPDSASYRERTIDMRGVDSHGGMPGILVSEVATVMDESRSTGLVGYVRGEDNQIVGRIFESGFEMEVQIDVAVAAGATLSIEEMRDEVELALRQYDSQFRDDLFPDGDGGGIGDIRNFSISRTQPADDLSRTPSMRRQRFSAEVLFVDRLNEVEEYGPIEPIKEVRTPRDGDYAGLSDDYYMEYHPPTDD